MYSHFIFIFQTYLGSWPLSRTESHAGHEFVVTSARRFQPNLQDNPMDKLDKLDIRELYSKQPPAFGHAMHQYFALDPEYINLNHGIYLPGQRCFISD